nr:(Fe-S)-binding protein [Clostridia bacterium]
RGFPMDADTAQTMYECLLCGSCTNDCVTGFEPPLYIRQARTEAAVEGLTPPAVQAVLDRLLETGNVFGSKGCALTLPSSKEGAEVLVWLGATARYAMPEIAKAFLSLLGKAKVDFQILPDEPDSGVALYDLLGPVEEVRQAAKQSVEAVNATGAQRLVVLDSYDAAFFLHTIREWGLELKPQMITATAFVDDLVKQGKLKPERVSGKVSYHDGSRLARDLDEHQPARDLLASMGFELCEMFLNRRLAKCCGTTLFGQYAPELLRKVAKGRWADAARTDARILVSACPQSAYALEQTVLEGFAFTDLFVLLDQHAQGE